MIDMVIIPCFLISGICVRTDHSSNFMHHKFVLVDGQLLINGSFNWTRNAITGNQENALITNHHKVVGAFQAEFEQLWQEFDPRNTFDTELSRKKRNDNSSYGDSKRLYDKWDV